MLLIFFYIRDFIRNNRRELLLVIVLSLIFFVYIMLFTAISLKFILFKLFLAHLHSKLFLSLFS